MQFNRLAFVDVGRPGEDGRRVSDLRIAFRVVKTLTPEANLLDIDIYNLSPTTRALFESAGNRVVLSAGYRGSETRVLAIGDVSNYETEYRGPDYITKVSAGDGLIALTDVRINLSFGPGASASQVVGAIADQLALDRTEIEADLNLAYRSGYSYCGRAKDALDEVGRKCRFSWSVQNNALQILRQAGASTREAVVISPTTGLIGSPKPLQDLEGGLFGAPPSDGVEFECLLNPRIEPGTLCLLSSRDFDNAQLVVQSVTHIGDTRGPGSDWRSVVEARRL